MANSTEWVHGNDEEKLEQELVDLLPLKYHRTKDPDTLRSLERKGIWSPNRINYAMCNIAARTSDLILERQEGRDSCVFGLKIVANFEKLEGGGLEDKGFTVYVWR